MKPFIWYIKTFKDISVDDLYKIVQLREKVFVVEQECVFLDADGLDLQAVHIYTKTDNGDISAYLRVLPPGNPYCEPSIGRVVVAKESRGQYLGKELMLQGIHYTKAFSWTYYSYCRTIILGFILFFIRLQSYRSSFFIRWY